MALPDTSPATLYRITLAATRTDFRPNENTHLEYSFVTVGPNDTIRMKRALYYFSIVLFGEGKQRHKLLTAPHNRDSTTSRMFQAVVSAYAAFVEHTGCDNNIVIVSAATTTDVWIVEPSVPMIRVTHTKPVPASFECKHCSTCFRVEDLQNGELRPADYTCAICRSTA